MEAEKIKESIKKAAQELFRKFGYHKTSVNEIAKRAKDSQSYHLQVFRQQRGCFACAADGLYQDQR